MVLDRLLILFEKIGVKLVGNICVKLNVGFEVLWFLLGNWLR